MDLIASLAADGYKLAHRVQYPEGTTRVYSTWTPRSGKHLPNVKEVVAFGFQGALKEITEMFDKQFFSRPKEEVVAEYKRHVSAYLFTPEVDASHLEELHDLGYLPIEVKALEEGTLVPFRVPMLTVENTVDSMFWLTNYLETILSALLWKPCTTASIARVYRQVLDQAAIETTGSKEGVEFQGHDFSMRGMSGPEDAARSGMGHILSFVGSDTLPAIAYAEQYYNADVTKELVACSVPASEHSVMCAGKKEDERETYRRFIEDLYPTGIVSIVSDTWDLWNVMDTIIPSLKDSILARDGGPESMDKVVIRPDSGNPVDILCGNKIYKVKAPDEVSALFLMEDYSFDSLADREGWSFAEDAEYTISELYSYNGKIYDVTLEYRSKWDSKELIVNEIREASSEDKGVIELLWDTFGGTTTEQGYKVLNPKIGAIYGDSITIERAKEIAKRLKAKGFASTNVVLGIGSYTYQMLTRDSLGFAMKATSVTVNGEERAIFKDPVTDDGTKKSAKGRVSVRKYPDGNIYYEDETAQEFPAGRSGDLLEPIYKDGKFLKETSLSKVREVMNGN